MIPQHSRGQLSPSQGTPAGTTWRRERLSPSLPSVFCQEEHLLTGWCLNVPLALASDLSPCFLTDRTVLEGPRALGGLRTGRRQPLARGTHRGAWEAWESVQPVAPLDTVVTFQTRHAGDTWLSPLTWGGIRGVTTHPSAAREGPRGWGPPAPGD